MGEGARGEGSIPTPPLHVTLHFYTLNRPFPSSKKLSPSFGSKCIRLSRENEFYLHEKKKNHFSIDGFALNLPSKQRHVILSKQCRIQTLRYGRGGSSILLEKGGEMGGLQKNFFQPFGPHFRPKNTGEGALPWIHHC